MHRQGSSPITPSSFSAAVSAAADVSSGLTKSPLSHPITVTPISAAYPSGDPMLMMSGSPLARVRLSDILPYEGAPSPAYGKAVEALSVSLMRYNASVIELGSEDTALMRCGLEAARLYFRTRNLSVSGKGNRGLSMYRAGRLALFFIPFCFFYLLDFPGLVTGFVLVERIGFALELNNCFDCSTLPWSWLRFWESRLSSDVYVV